MKTAEEWALDKANGFGFSYIDSIEPERLTFLGTEVFLRQIKQIQLDAWKQGMTDAADLAGGCSVFITRKRDSTHEIKT